MIDTRVSNREVARLPSRFPASREPAQFLFAVLELSIGRRFATRAEVVDQLRVVGERLTRLQGQTCGVRFVETGL